MEHDIPFGNSNRENGTTFFDFPLFLGIFQWDEPTKRVPFTAKPEIPEILSKKILCPQSLLVFVLRRRGGSGDENDFSPVRSSFLTSLRARIANKPQTWSDFSVAGWLSWQQWYPTLRRAMGMDKITEQQTFFFSSWKKVILSSLQNRKITRSRLRNGALVLALTPYQISPPPRRRKKVGTMQPRLML